jgi:hypothetical protein
MVDNLIRVYFFIKNKLFLIFWVEFIHTKQMQIDTQSQEERRLHYGEHTKFTELEYVRWEYCLC